MHAPLCQVDGHSLRYCRGENKCMHPCVKWMVTASDTAEVRTNACIIVLSEYGGAVTASVALATAWRLTQCMDAPPCMAYWQLHMQLIRLVKLHVCCATCAKVQAVSHEYTANPGEHPWNSHLGRHTSSLTHAVLAFVGYFCYHRALYRRASCGQRMEDCS